jgi:hypothetical protein
LSEAIASIIVQRYLEDKLIELWSGLYLLAILLFWIFLGVKGLLPATPPRKHRRGYRQSGKA